MSLLDLHDIKDEASYLYDSESRLRRKEGVVTDVRFGKHPVEIPPSMAGRAIEVKTHSVTQKLETAKFLLTDPDGLQVTVAPTGSSDTAIENGTRVQSWLAGILARLESLRHAEEWVVEDLLVRSRAYIKVFPMPAAWQDLPYPALDLNDVTTLDIDAIEERIGRTRAEHRRLCEKQPPPIYLSHVPAESVIVREDAWGQLAEVYEYQEMSAWEVLHTFKNEDGSPAATRLKELVDLKHLAPRDTVTVVTRADREHLQIALVDLTLTRTAALRHDAQQVTGTDEILAEWEHGMDCVPYVRFRGREAATADPPYRYQGFLDNVWDLQVALDYAMTQMASTVRMVAWPGAYVKRNPVRGMVPGGGDAQETFTLPEGGINDSLKVGEEIDTMRMLDQAAWQLFREYVQFLIQRINLNTIPDSVTGGNSADSGYLFAQLQAAAESVLEPWVRGLQRGWAEVCGLLLRAATCIMREGAPPIPVRYTTEGEGARWVEIPLSLAEQEWETTVALKTRMIGGEMAQVQALSAMKAQGWISDVEVLRRLGFRNPQAELERIWIEQIVNGTGIIQTVTEQVMLRSMAALQNAQPANLPTNATIPAALASVLSTPEALARLPGGFNPAYGAAGGNPAVAGPDVSPPPPTLTEQQGMRLGLEAAGVGPAGAGPAAGQAQAQPGGSFRMSDVLGLR